MFTANYRYRSVEVGVKRGNCGEMPRYNAECWRDDHTQSGACRLNENVDVGARARDGGVALVADGFS
jgi:hypothetical protein